MQTSVYGRRSKRTSGDRLFSPLTVAHTVARDSVGETAVIQHAWEAEIQSPVAAGLKPAPAADVTAKGGGLRAAELIPAAIAAEH
jgi:hypothetical protein